MAQKRFSRGDGPTQRQLRVGEQIRRRLADILIRGDVHDPELNAMSITVGEVRTSPDLRHAEAFVMPLGGVGKEEALAALRRNRTELRRLVVQGLSLKFAPELRFRADETFDRMDETRRLLDDERVRRDIAAETAPDDADGQ